jgi:hypothetical protein
MRGTNIAWQRLPTVPKRQTSTGGKIPSSFSHNATAAKKIQEHTLDDNKNPNPKQRGDHYNPGNMSGKNVGTHTDETEANTKNRNSKQQGDDFNPGNMSGKTVGTHKDESKGSKR